MHVIHSIPIPSAAGQSETSTIRANGVRTGARNSALYSMMLFLLVALTSGCLSPSKKLEASAVAHIKNGITTRGEIESQFGKPKRALLGSNGKTLAEYAFMIKTSSGLQGPAVSMRNLSLLYDERGVVEKHVHHETTQAVEFGVTAMTAGATAEPRLGLIVKGVTTAVEVGMHFGPPTFKTLTVDGDLVLGWLHARRQRGDQIHTQVEEFAVLVDDRGLVRDFIIKSASVPRLSP